LSQRFAHGDMMDKDQMFHLKWEKHQLNLANTFQALRKDGHFCDVTIACDGKVIEAHKLVLSASSSLFNTILKKHSHPHPFIYLMGARAVDMDALIEFMYCGEVKVEQDQLKSFIETAEEFRVQGLCQDIFKEETNCQDKHKACLNPDSTSSLKLCQRNVLGNVTDQILEEQTSSHLGRSSKSSPGCASKTKQLGKLRNLIDDFLSGEVTKFKLAEEVKEYKDLEKFLMKKKDGKAGSGVRREYQCMLCGTTKGNKTHLLDHIENAHFSKVLDNTCNVCKKRMSTKQSLRCHQQRKHAHKKPLANK